MLPHAREDGLTVQELEGETLVYDEQSCRAHCLNRTASLVWRHCDGRTSVAEIATLLRRELDTPVDKQVVLFALERLRKAHLLRAGTLLPSGSVRYSRREIIQKIGLAGGVALLLPAVDSIVAPTPASAASCLPICVGKPNGTVCGPPCDGSKCCQGGLCKAGGNCNAQG